MSRSKVLKCLGGLVSVLGLGLALLGPTFPQASPPRGGTTPEWPAEVRRDLAPDGGVSKSTPVPILLPGDPGYVDYSPSMKTPAPLSVRSNSAAPARPMNPDEEAERRLRDPEISKVL